VVGVVPTVRVYEGFQMTLNGRRLIANESVLVYRLVRVAGQNAARQNMCFNVTDEMPDLGAGTLTIGHPVVLLDEGRTGAGRFAGRGRERWTTFNDVLDKRISATDRR
jgi:hypothetical protein